MIIPHQSWTRGWLKSLRSHHVAAAHVDWVLLSLVKFGAAYLLTLRPVPNGEVVARLIDFSGWVAPTTYFMKTWGVNGFNLDGKKFVDTVVGLAGFAATTSFTYAWFKIVVAWY